MQKKEGGGFSIQKNKKNIPNVSSIESLNKLNSITSDLQWKALDDSEKRKIIGDLTGEPFKGYLNKKKIKSQEIEKTITRLSSDDVQKIYNKKGIMDEMTTYLYYLKKEKEKEEK